MVVVRQLCCELGAVYSVAPIVCCLNQSETPGLNSPGVWTAKPFPCLLQSLHSLLSIRSSTFNKMERKIRKSGSIKHENLSVFPSGHPAFLCMSAFPILKGNLGPSKADRILTFTTWTCPFGAHQSGMSPSVQSCSWNASISICSGRF